jgi:hypothetical protein
VLDFGPGSDTEGTLAKAVALLAAPLVAWRRALDCIDAGGGVAYLETVTVTVGVTVVSPFLKSRAGGSEQPLAPDSRREVV